MELFLRPNEYQVTPVGASRGTVAIVDGVMFLKYVFSESHVNTSMTVNTIKLRLLNLPRIIEIMSSNIEEFNTYVEQQVIALVARGEASDDQLVSLFQEYKVVNDCDF